MATIKSALVLEDRMSPALSKAEQQAIRNVNAYEQLDSSMNALVNQMNKLQDYLDYKLIKINMI